MADGRGACSSGARRPTRSASSTRTSSCSARRPTGATASSRRAGRCSSSRRGVRPRRRRPHGGRMFRENVRGHLRFFAKHHGPRRGRAGAAAAARRAPAARAVFPRRARPHVPRRRPRRCDPARVPWELARAAGARRRAAAARHGVGLWAAALRGDGVLLLPGALVARGARAPGFSAALAWALGALFAGAGARLRSSHASLGLALVLLAVVAAAALVAVLRQTPKGSVPGDAARAGRGGCCRASASGSRSGH